MSDSEGPTGFWSYVHRDDEAGGGRIRRLAARIADEFSMLTGFDIEVFVDRDSIAWGDQWRLKINMALQDTTFFIPVITPRYFVSQECRNELLKFIAHARSLGAEELLLPILWVDVDDLEPESGDEAKASVARTQYADWRKLRLVDEETEEYVRGVNDLAARLAAISRSYAERPSVVPEEVNNQKAGLDQYDDDAPGVLDLIARLDDALPAWQQTIEDFTLPMTEITEIAQRTTAKIHAGDNAGKGFGYRVVVAREMATEMEGPAARMEALGEKYAAQLLEIDPGVRALIALASEPGRSSEDQRSASEMFQSLKGLVEVSRQSAVSVQDFADSLRGPASQFKDLRPVLRKTQAGLRSVLDGQAILEEWDRLIDGAGENPTFGES